MNCKCLTFHPNIILLEDILEELSMAYINYDMACMRDFRVRADEIDHKGRTGKEMNNLVKSLEKFNNFHVKRQ